jgi:FkbM family methyltransferase
LRNYRNWPTVVLADVFGAKYPLVIRTRNGTEMVLREQTSDFGTFHAVWSYHLYNPDGFAIGPDDTVVDIGGHVGSFSVLAGRAVQHGNGRVCTMEPFPDNYRMLVENVARNGLEKKITTLPAAGWGTSGTLELIAYDQQHRNGLRMVRSTGMHTALAERAAANAAKIKVPCMTLDDLLRTSGIAKVDFLKLDCEGAEYEILFKASPDAIRRIDRIAMEIHETPTAGADAMCGFLRAQGFHTYCRRECIFATRRTRC